jgi:hypothetical protein
MPVEFLTDEQAASYGKFNEEPTRPELERFFYLDDEDRKLIATRRGDHNRLGFALQMCTVSYIGRFLPDDPLDVPWVVIEHIAEQLGIEDVSSIKQYTERLKTAYEHAWEIRDVYEYHEYEDPEWSRRFRTFLHGRAWTAHAEGPKALFDHAVGWLRKNRVLLPGYQCSHGRCRRFVRSRTRGCTRRSPRRRSARTSPCPRIWRGCWWSRRGGGSPT